MGIVAQLSIRKLGECVVLITEVFGWDFGIFACQRNGWK